jgi:serine/threonine protein kinase
MPTCPRCSADCEERSPRCARCGAVLTSGISPSRGIASPEPRDVARDFSQDYDIGTILGSYRLLELIGEGGMGRVFLAEHVRLGRKVAVKMLLSEYGGNTEAVRRFFAEARAVCQISHENIIEISDFVENDLGRSYYVMELLRGVTLAELIKREKVLPLTRTLEIATQVSSALAAVHGAGIIHRDLKPDNIFLIERGERKDFVKMLDFGVAKLLYNDTDGGVARTGAGFVIGTPGYMSPEQAAGQTVDHRTDVYALGVILFEMVTGQTPFAAVGYRDLLMKHMTMAPPKPSRVAPSSHTIPPKLEKLILECLAKEPRDRPASTKEITTRLQSMVPTLIRGSSAAGMRARANRMRLAAAATAAAVLVVGLVAVPVVRRLTSPAESVAPPPLPASAQSPSGSGSTRSVEITFDSFPRGAQIYRVSGTKGPGGGQHGEAPLGSTPLMLSFPSSAEASVFELRMDGAAVRREVSMEHDATVMVTFAAAKAAEAEPGKSREPPRRRGGRRGEHGAPAANPKLDRDAVLNPFTD